MAKKKYLEFEEQLEEVDIGLIDGELDVLIDRLKKLGEKYTSTHSKIRIKVEYGSWDDSDEFYLMGTRSETDKERDKRLARAKKIRDAKKAQKLKQEEHEKELLGRLLKKHGNILEESNE